MIPHTVGILGGMGPAAGADFVRLFVQACGEHLRAQGGAVNDQAYPPHWLAQMPVPDRSAALADAQAPQPLEPMKDCLAQLASLGVRAAAIACNTAHAWHPQLQAAFPSVRLLNAMEEVAQHLLRTGISAVGLLATEGTYGTGLYQRALSRHGILCVEPTPEERGTLMRGIYGGVKSGNVDLAASLFGQVARALVSRHSLGALVLGCTEIPLALQGSALPGVELIDPAQLLARRLAASAYEAYEAG